MKKNRKKKKKRKKEKKEKKKNEKESVNQKEDQKSPAIFDLVGLIFRAMIQGFSRRSKRE